VPADSPVKHMKRSDLQPTKEEVDAIVQTMKVGIHLRPFVHACPLGIPDYHLRSHQHRVLLEALHRDDIFYKSKLNIEARAASYAKVVSTKQRRQERLLHQQQYALHIGDPAFKPTQPPPRSRPMSCRSGKTLECNSDASLNGPAAVLAELRRFDALHGER